MHRRAIIAAAAITAVGVAGLTPAVAKTRPKPISGHWSFMDVTPDPLDTVFGVATEHPYCHDPLPAMPGVDVNKHAIKVKGRGVLSVAGANTGDWAMEVDDAKGRVLGTSDGGGPNDQEGVIVDLPRAGSYSVLYCNLGGSPQATAKYRFVYR